MNIFRNYGERENFGGRKAKEPPAQSDIIQRLNWLYGDASERMKSQAADL